MSILITILITLIVIAGALAALLSTLFFIRLRWPSPVLWFVKLFTSALSPYCMLAGALNLMAGLVYGSIIIFFIGFYVLLVFGYHIYGISRPPGSLGNFEQAFGPDWKQLTRGQQNTVVRPGGFKIKLPKVPAPRLEQNIPFAKIPGTDRKLLCDIWQPSKGIPPSGIGFIYLHGSAFYFLDKDFGTRPFFTQLTAKGHMVMDVAYRLAPETDMMGMTGDAKRAIDWMRENAATYNVQPEKIIIGGGSAGGHLALLAAYTDDDPRFTPLDLAGKDVSVAAVISLYGSNDMEALYYHTNQHLTTSDVPHKLKKAVPAKIPAWLIKRMGKDYFRLGMNKDFAHTGALAPLMGGHPEENPEAYARFTVINHVHRNCPPTLLIHDEDDILAPVRSTRKLFMRLKEYKVPVVMHILPQTDHAFDLVLPGISPGAHTALSDVEQFMAIIASKATARESKVTGKEQNAYTFHEA